MRFKTRLNLTFGLFTLLLCVLFLSLLSESLTELEDHMLASFLTQEADYLNSRYRENPGLLVMPDLDQLKGYRSGEANLPAWLEPLQAGYHQTQDFHVLVQELDTDLRIYLVYDEASGVLDQQETTMWLVLGLITLIVLAVGLGLGSYQAKVLARPVNKLVAQVEQVSPENPEITPLPNDDEIGQLSHAYADLIDRLAEFIKREQAFTRYASHELMTPVSIMRNNLELLQNKNVSAELQHRAIERLQHATKSMQRQIEIFLMLAREKKLEPARYPLNWDSLWQDMQAQFPRVSLSLNIKEEPKIFVDEAVIQTIVANVLGNVVKHGAPQQDVFNASITLDKHSLSISNPIPRDEDQEPTIYGFGLEINKKLCQAIGWDFTTSQDSNIFSVTINFALTDA